MIGQQPDILGEHAEDEAVYEMRHLMCLVTAIAQPLGEARELARRFLGQRLARPLRLEGLWLDECLLQLLSNGAVD
jgi:hypothetical protein